MKRSLTALIAGSLLAISFTVFAAGGAIEGVEKQPLNISAIVMFLIFVVATLGITYWAAKDQDHGDFYTAGGGITGFQNGLAIAGDYMSAATLLGLTCMVYFKGYDGFIYCHLLLRRLADHHVPDGGAPAQPRQVHLRRHRLLPSRPEPQSAPWRPSVR